MQGYITKFKDLIDGAGEPLVSMVGRCLFDIMKPYLSNKRHLDIGCWTGGFLSLCQAVTSRSIGIDLQLSPLIIAKQFNPELLFISGSALSLPLQDSCIDIVTLIEVIEHVPKDFEITLLKEVGRVLYSGGKLFLTTPNSNPIGMWADPAYFFGHRHYSLAKLKKILGTSGFKITLILHRGGFFQVFNGLILTLHKYLLKKIFLAPSWLNYLIKRELCSNKTWWTSAKIIILAEKES